jgi:hypothetical protein
MKTRAGLVDDDVVGMSLFKLVEEAAAPEPRRGPSERGARIGSSKAIPNNLMP